MLLLRLPPSMQMCRIICREGQVLARILRHLSQQQQIKGLNQRQEQQSNLTPKACKKATRAAVGIHC
jgi:hypothetical protein